MATAARVWVVVVVCVCVCGGGGGGLEAENDVAVGGPPRPVGGGVFGGGCFPPPR
eukprot:COSAG03_NODE_18245_length_359_cov_0.557692_1_plen_54_part_01